MQKVVCPACGLVNLESFPTYPQCAACGVRLPERKRRPVHDFFQRPVKTLVWAFCVGASVAVLALLSTGIARETQLRDRGPLLVTSLLQYNTQNNGANLVLLLRVNTSLPGDRERIRNLHLRLNEKDAREADFRVVSPLASIEQMGGGRHYIWDQLTPGQTIKVLLRPHHALKVNMVANGFLPFELQISPQSGAPPSVDLSPNRSN